MFRASLSENVPYTLKPVAFLVAFQIILTFSETGHKNQKVGTSANKMLSPEGTFLWWGLFIPRFKTIAYVVDKQVIYVEDTFCYTDYVCQNYNICM